MRPLRSPLRTCSSKDDSALRPPNWIDTRSAWSKGASAAITAGPIAAKGVDDKAGAAGERARASDERPRVGNGTPCPTDDHLGGLMSITSGFSRADRQGEIE